MEKWRILLYYQVMSDLSPPQFSTLRINAAPAIYRCEAGWHWAPPPLPDHDFWFVVSGKGTLERNGELTSASAGSCFLLRPGDTPRGSQDPEDRLTVFFAHFDLLDEVGNVIVPLDFAGPIEVRDTLAFVASAHRIVRLWQRADTFAHHQAQMLLGVLLWQLWDESRFPASPVNDVFESLAAAIRREPGRSWTLDLMANQVSLSRAQFTRRFRAIFDTSPTHFVIQTRLERARYLLRETEMTLEQIARGLGYADVFFFARQFKQFTGKTPGDVRRFR